MLRLAIANIHRPGALTVSVVLSLGLPALRSPIAGVVLEVAESMGAPVSRVRITLVQPVAHRVRSDRNTIVVDFDKPSADVQKVRMARRLRQETTMTLQWIAERLQIGTKTHSAHLLYWQQR